MNLLKGRTVISLVPKIEAFIPGSNAPAHPWCPQRFSPLQLGQLLKWSYFKKVHFCICFIVYIWTIWCFDNRIHTQHLINLCMCLMANLCCIRWYYLIKLYDKCALFPGTARHFFESKLWKTVVGTWSIYMARSLYQMASFWDYSNC